MQKNTFIQIFAALFLIAILVTLLFFSPKFPKDEQMGRSVLPIQLKK